MGSIRKRNGTFQAQVRREGVKPVSKTFKSKRDAEAWIRSVETRIDAGELNVATPKLLTLGQILARYAAEITVQKKGRKQEQRRINRLQRDPITAVRLSRLSSNTIAEFRDRRIKDGTRATQIDLILIRHCIKIARTEWGINMHTNPVEAVRIPNGINRRERRLKVGEFERLREAAKQCKNALIWPCIEFAIETGMRRSEILSMIWVDVDMNSGVALLPQTKNGSYRQVPLTARALTILKSLPKSTEHVFPISDSAVRQAWVRLVKRADLQDLRFHDLRHEAVSRFFEIGLSVAEVASISGHKDPRMLFRYTHMSTETISAKLRHAAQRNPN